MLASPECWRPQTSRGPTNDAGLFLELDAIVAVVVGGTALTGGRFYLLGSVIGAIIIQTLTTTITCKNVSSDVVPVPKAIGDPGGLPVTISVFRLQIVLLVKRSPASQCGGRRETSARNIFRYWPRCSCSRRLYSFGCVRFEKFV